MLPALASTRSATSAEQNAMKAMDIGRRSQSNRSLQGAQ